MNRDVFFSYVRNAPFGGRLTQQQVGGLSLILDEWESRGLEDDRWLANILAQSFWETGKTMQPVREIGKGRGRAYGVPVGPYKHVYYGRGHIQLTWESNYRKMGGVVNEDLVQFPDKALDPKVSIKIMFEGMIRGLFTGKKLEDYFNDTKDDPIWARSIVNGRRRGERLPDKAELIAGFHKNFLDAIKASKKPEKTKEIKKADAQPDDVKPSQSASLWATVTSLVSGVGGLGFLGSIDNPYALGATALIVFGAGIAAWAVLTGRVTFNKVKEDEPISDPDS